MFTVKTPKSKSVGIKITQLVESEKYENLIANLDYYDRENAVISEAASSLTKTKAYRRRKLIHKRSKLQEKLQEKLFTEAVYNVFYNALLLDESVKRLHDEKLFALTEETVKNYLSSNNVRLTDLKKRNGLLEDLVTLCEEIAHHEVKDRFSEDDILNELDSEEDDKMEIDADSKELFDREVKDISSQVVDDVKSRVLETIEREQKIATEKKEMEDEISTYTTQVSGTPEITTAGSMTGGQDNRDDSSDSEETAPEMGSDDKSAPATEPKNLEESACITFETFNPTKKLSIRKANRLQEQTFFTYIVKSISNKAAKEATLNESHINMDSIFSESVMMLTLFESLQLLGVTNFNSLELKQFGRQLLEESRK